MTSIPLTQARAEFFDLVEQAAGGEHITLTSHGVPRAMLVPLPENEDSRPIAFTREQLYDISLHRMDAAAWDDIRFPGDTIGEDGLD